MSRPTDGGPGERHLPLDRSGDLVARGELVHEALAARVEQPGSLAAHRLGDQEAVGAVIADHRGGMELHQLEVGQRRAGREREQQSPSDRARGVGRARPQGGGTAGGEHDGAGGDLVAVVEADSDATTAVDDQLHDPPALEHLDVGVLGDDRGKLPDQAPAGRGSAGVHDPPRRVTALEAEGQMAAAVRVEAHAQPGQVGDGFGRLLAQDARRGLAHGVTAGGDRVLQVALRAVLRRDRGSQAALSPPARGLGQRRGRDQRDAGPVPGGAHGRVQPGGAGADHCHLSREYLHVDRYRTPMASAPVWLEHPVVPAPRHGRASRARRADGRDRPRAVGSELARLRARHLAGDRPDDARNRPSPRRTSRRSSGYARPVAVCSTSTRW